MKKYIYLFLMFLLLASCNIALQTEDDVENTSIIPRKETISNMDEIDLCTNYYRNDTLFFATTSRKANNCLPFSELKTKYLNEVKSSPSNACSSFYGRNRCTCCYYSFHG